MNRIGIGLSLVVLAGFAATAAVDRRGESAELAVAIDAAGQAVAPLSLPAWHPPVLPEGHPAVLPPGHPPILRDGHPPAGGDALACPGGSLLPGWVPGVEGGRPAEPPAVISI